MIRCPAEKIIETSVGSVALSEGLPSLAVLGIFCLSSSGSRESIPCLKKKKKKCTVLQIHRRSAPTMILYFHVFALAIHFHGHWGSAPATQNYSRQSPPNAAKTWQPIRQGNGAHVFKGFISISALKKQYQLLWRWALCYLCRKHNVFKKSPDIYVPSPRNKMHSSNNSCRTAVPLIYYNTF